MMLNNHYCIQGICNRGFTLDCVLDILWIGFIFVTDKNWFYLVSICILNRKHQMIWRDQEVGCIKALTCRNTHLADLF